MGRWPQGRLGTGKGQTCSTAAPLQPPNLPFHTQLTLMLTACSDTSSWVLRCCLIAHPHMEQHGAPEGGGGPAAPPTATPSPMANSLRSPSALMSHQHQDKKGWQSQRMLIRGKASLKQNRSPKGAGGGQESTPQGTEVLHLWAPRGAVVGCIAPHGAHGMDCCALQSYRCRAAPG